MLNILFTHISYFVGGCLFIGDYCENKYRNGNKMIKYKECCDKRGYKGDIFVKNFDELKGCEKEYLDFMKSILNV